jgi:mRNA interferase HigB
MRALREFWQAGHADAERPLRAWFSRTNAAEWSSFADLRQDFQSADQVGNHVVFNVGGNNYRLVANVNYQSHYVLVRWIGTHAEYDRIKGEIKKW